MTPQPISTAPEYTRMLVYCQRPAVNTGWWQIAEFDEEIGEWLDDAVDGESCLVKPTYWLPLPPPPVTEESPATLIEPLADGTTYTRSYQVFLPNPPNPPKPQ